MTKSRKWDGPTGVIEGRRPEPLPDDIKRQITIQLSCYERKKLVPTETFFWALSEALANFEDFKKLHESSLPGRVRENLKNALAHASALDDSIETASENALALDSALKDLDGLSRELIAEVSQDGIKGLHKHVTAVILALKSAQLLAQKYPMRGRLPNVYRLNLVRGIARAIEDHLGVKPTKTKAGPVEAIAEILLEYLGAKDTKALHELIRKAINSPAEVKPDGVVEYHPKKPK